MFTSIDLLLENAPEDFLGAAEILVKFAANVLADSNNPKFRRIRVGNEKVVTRLLPVSGAMECLFEMGFIEDGDFVTLPMGTSLALLQQLKDELEKHCNRIASTRTATPTIHEASPAIAFTSAASVEPRQPSMAAAASQRTFFQKVKSSFEHVLVYEDEALQEKARSCIPIEELKSVTESQIVDLGLSRSSFRDLFLVQILAWFKNSFFAWTDAPKCQACHGATHAVGIAEPTPEELVFGGRRVENYQ